MEKPNIVCVQIESPYETEISENFQKLFQCIFICFDIRNFDFLNMELELPSCVLSFKHTNQKDENLFSNQWFVKKLISTPMMHKSCLQLKNIRVNQHL